MRNAAVVARWELRRTIGRKAFLISTATMPVLLAIVVLVVVLFGDRIGGAVAEASTPDAGDSYGLIDHAGALDGRDLPSSFTRFVDEAAARTAEAQGAIAGYFVVAADYEQSGHGALRGRRLRSVRRARGRGSRPDPVRAPRRPAAGACGAGDRRPHPATRGTAGRGP